VPTVRSESQPQVLWRSRDSEAPEELHLDDEGVEEEGDAGGVPQEGATGGASEAGAQSLAVRATPSEGTDSAPEQETSPAEGGESPGAQPKGELTFVLAEGEHKGGRQGLAAVGEGGEEITFNLTEAQEEAAEAEQGKGQASAERRRSRRRLLSAVSGATGPGRSPEERAEGEQASPGRGGQPPCEGVPQLLRSGMRALLAAPQTPAEGSASGQLKPRERRRKTEGEEEAWAEKELPLETGADSKQALGADLGAAGRTRSTVAPLTLTPVGRSEEEPRARKADSRRHSHTGRPSKRKGRQRKGSRSKRKPVVEQTEGSAGEGSPVSEECRRPGGDQYRWGRQAPEERSPGRSEGRRSKKALLDGRASQRWACHW